MKVCPACFHRKPDWMYLCEDCLAELEPWNEGFDQNRRVRRGTVVNDVYEWLGLDIKGHDVTIVLEKFNTPSISIIENNTNSNNTNSNNTNRNNTNDEPSNEISINENRPSPHSPRQRSTNRGTTSSPPMFLLNAPPPMQHINPLQHNTKTVTAKYGVTKKYPKPPKDTRSKTIESIADLAEHVEYCIYSIDQYSDVSPVTCHQRLEKILGSGCDALFDGGAPRSAKGDQRKREAFLKALAEHFRKTAKFKWGPSYNDSTIELGELIGKNNVKLFQEAIEEELKSANYRTAVVLHGVDTYMEAAASLSWSKAKHFIIGGSSGAGKTRGAKTIMLALNLCLQYELEEVENFDDRKLCGQLMTGIHSVKEGFKSAKKIEYIVSVDGGDARAVSQIRGIVLQCALALGYKGISDLQKQTGKMDFKDCIKNAARNAKVHIVEPRTFATSEEKYEKIVTDPKRTIFCMVHTDGKVIECQGNRRAWYDFKSEENLHRSLLPIQPNNREIGCESKAYGGGGRVFGLAFSQKTLKEFVEKRIEHMGKLGSPICVELINNAVLENGGKSVSYKIPAHVWVYVEPPRSKALFGGMWEIDNVLKFEPAEKLYKTLGSKYKQVTSKYKVVNFSDKFCVIASPPSNEKK